MTAYLMQTTPRKTILFITFRVILDTDECARNISGCNQNCTNTKGSYVCSCYPGYEIENDNKTCIGKHLMQTAP